MKPVPLNHADLENLLIKWEGGEIVDRDALIRELAKVFRDAAARERLEKIIG